MNRLSAMLIKAFALPLVVTFLIVQFILVMQFLWLYIDDLVGKGLEWWIIAELIFYASASFVPLALPLAILLASIMTMGTLSEHGELTAVKSSGISLLRFLRPLFGLVFLICLLAFYFSDTVLPNSRLKFGSLLYDVQQKKPALAIKPGVFYKDIEGYSLMVRRRDADQQTVHDIIIYDRSSGGAYPRVTVARRGKFIHSQDQRFLTVRLEDGFTYTEQGASEAATTMNGESRILFRKQEIHLDLSQLKLRRSDESLFKDYYSMLNTRQLAKAIDSLKRDNQSRDSSLNDLILGQYHFGRKAVVETSEPLGVKPEATRPVGAEWSANNPDLIQEALRQIQTVKSYTDMKNREMRNRRELLARYIIEFHRKFSLSFACLLLFMVGAPLGAVIRKGGLGLPTVWAIGCFLVYHVISMSSEKLGRDGSIDPRWAMWVSSLFLLPLATWLLYRVNLDRKLTFKL
ncbi:MAG: LptF/LptG family permease [Bacteroidota bacterium]